MIKGNKTNYILNTLLFIIAISILVLGYVINTISKPPNMFISPSTTIIDSENYNFTGNSITNINNKELREIIATAIFYSEYSPNINNKELFDDTVKFVNSISNKEMDSLNKGHINQYTFKYLNKKDNTDYKNFTEINFYGNKYLVNEKDKKLFIYEIKNINQH